MRHWTDEERKAQSEKMRQLKPWEKSTGPKTAEGKKKASMNALKHGLDSKVATELRRVLRAHQKFLKELK